MSQPAISVRDVAKLYRIGVNSEGNDSVIKAAFNAIRSPIKNFKTYRSLYKFDDVETMEDTENTLWALKGVTFDVQPGELVGIIGRNGAGKSTLLKVLSKITSPTRGSMQTRGRISSLLEVGTGFHQELTGRENTYLNGTILGMRKTEIDRKFDEIVHFSGVEKFLDTPVKRYSSGMRVRLAFAVAAHLEPEILIVDEVLAVGDAAFQKKCLEKMEDVGGEGRTVLFVSHNMAAITRMCSRCVLLNSGRVELDGPAKEVVSAYLGNQDGSKSRVVWDGADAPGDNAVRLREVRLMTEGDEISDSVDIRHPVVVELEYDVLEEGHVMQPHVVFSNEEGVQLFAAVDLDPMWRGRPRSVGRYVTRARVPGNFFTEGLVSVDTAFWSIEPRLDMHLHERDVVVFHVNDPAGVPDSARGDWTGQFHGLIRPMLDWQTPVYPGSGDPQPVALKR